MKVFVGTLFMVLIGVVIGYRQYGHHREHIIGTRVSENMPTASWIPTDADLASGNQGVGWVFGRMIGVADAPGSLNYSPFGANYRSPTLGDIAP